MNGQFLCLGCKRYVDHLVEIVLTINPGWIETIRCEDCIQISIERIRQMDNFPVN